MWRAGSQTRKWQGQDGQDRYTTEIVANDMKMLGGRGGGGGEEGGWSPLRGAAALLERRLPGGREAGRPAAPPDPDIDDDIPF